MSPFPILFFLFLPLWIIGCQTTPPLQTSIQEGSSGNVYLETVTHQAFRATHPVSLPLPTIYKVLSGVKIRVQQHLLQKLLSGPPPIHSIFSEPNLSFLATGLQAGLQKASPNEMIRFTLFEAANGAHDTTEGTVFHHDSSLYVTMTALSSTIQTGSASSRSKKQLKDINSFYSTEFTFIPESAIHSPSDSLHLPNGRHNNTIVIRYSSLSSTDSPTQQPQADSSGYPEPQATVSPEEGMTPLPQDSQTLKGVVIQQRQELHELRKELNRIQRDLQEFPNESSPE